MTDDYTVLTPENVLLRFHVAGMGSRFAAAVVDYLIVGFAYLALALGAAAVGAATDALSLPGIVPSVLAAILLLLTFLLWWGYFVLFELLWNGQSPGKRLLHIRVARADSLPVGPSTAIVRNLMRIVDTLLFLGPIVMLVDAQGRRLGDLAAGTLVVRETTGSLAALDTLADPALPLISREQFNAFVPARPVGRAQYTLARDYFARRSRLTGDASAVVARAVAENLADSLELPREQIGDPEEFLTLDLLRPSPGEQDAVSPTGEPNRVRDGVPSFQNRPEVAALDAAKRPHRVG